MALVVMLRTRLTAGGAPEPVVADTAASLRALGHEVLLLAWDREAQHPTVSETAWGAVWRYRRRCALNEPATFARELPRFLLWALRQLLLLRREPLVIHCHDLDTLPLGVWAAKLLRRPLVYDCHENYPALVADAVPAAVTLRLQRLEARLLRSCDGVIAGWLQGYAYLDAMLRHGPSAPSTATLAQALEVLALPPATLGGGRLVLLGNLKRLEDYPPGMAEPEGLPDGFRLLYIGVIERRPARGLVEAAVAVEGLAGVRFLVGGFGTLVPRLRRLTRRLRQTVLLGPIPPAEVPAYTTAADAVLLALDPANLNNRLSAPNKLYEAMAAGVPLVTCTELLAGRIVEQEGIGVTFPWGDWWGLQAAVRWLRDNPAERAAMGRRGRALAEQKFNWRICEQRLGALYRRVLDE